MFERELQFPAGLEEAARSIARVLADPLPTYIDTAVIATTADGRIAFWNDAAERLYGWTAEEAVGRDIVELTPASVSRDAFAEIMRVLQTGEAWEGEIVLRRRDGAPFVAYVMDLPVGDLAGGAGAIVGISLPAKHRRLIDHRRNLIRAAVQARFQPRPH